MKGLLEEVTELDQEILEFIGMGVDHDDTETFNALALRVFEIQYENILLYQNYCKKRSVTPKEVDTWEQIPPIPTDVFKAADLVLLPSYGVRTFMTSGTSNQEERGKVIYDGGGLRLMDCTIRTAASALLFPDGIRASILIIAPPPELAPNMVMAYGMDRLMEYFGRPGSRFLVGEEGFQAQELVDELRKCEAQGTPAAIFGGSFGFVNFFDFCRKGGLRFQLPSGSRCLDAGGFKGRSREVEREEFLDEFEAFFGISRAYCVNLLGMTEIASQFYDNSIKNLYQGIDARRVKTNTPWTKTLVVDPDSLEPLAEGETGLLRHFDLANRGHICAIQTDDMGRLAEEGFEVMGRAKEGDARGCSITVDEMTRIMEEG